MARRRRRITATVEGGKELLERLHRMGVDVVRVLEIAAQAGATVIAAEANRHAPRPEIATDVAERKAGRRGRVSVDIGPVEERWYWRFLEYGAQPHEIKGRRKRLAFEGEEGLVRTWLVHHPGIAPRPFLRPAMDSRQDEATDAVGAHIREVVER